MHLENRDNSLFLHYTFRLDLVEKKWYTDNPQVNNTIHVNSTRYLNVDTHLYILQLAKRNLFNNATFNITICKEC